MNGYSRMGASSDSAIVVGDSRSVDLPAGSGNPSLQYSSSPTRRPQHSTLPWGQPQKEEIGLGVPVPLSRSRSSASQRFATGASATLQAAVKRAFSMRKSSSVREGYWRIHDSTGDDEDGVDEGFAEAGEQGQQPPRRRRPSPEQQHGRRKKGKLIRACKRIFGY